MASARDRFWVFTVKAGWDNSYMTMRKGGSRMTPAESAYYLDVPGLIFVNADGIPVPYSRHAEQYAVSFRPLDRVLWSITGSGGFSAGNEEDYVVDLRKRFPNIQGVFMDDFFGKFEEYDYDSKRIIEYLTPLRAKLDACDPPLELYVVWYTHEFEHVAPEVFEYIDGVTLWTWDCTQLPTLEKNYERLEAALPGKKRLLGCYFFDFPSRTPVPVDLMKHQCELGFELMKQGRLDGLIFEANTVMDVGFESVEWTRNWIQEIKDEPVPE